MSDLILKYRALKNSLLKKWKSDLTPQFQRAAQWIAVLGVLISSYYAVITYRLTEKLGENKDQINRLDTIVVSQKSQIDTLVSILKELRIQNGYSKEQGVDLKNQTGEVLKQTQILGDQFNILDSQNRLYNRKNVLENSAAYSQFNKTLGQIAFLMPFGGKKEMYSYEDEQALYFLESLKRLLENEFGNLYILSTPDLEAKWKGLYTATDFCLKALEEGKLHGLQPGYIKTYNDTVIWIRIKYGNKSMQVLGFIHFTTDSVNLN